ncbi:MAG: hypothetical protein GXP06_13915 [Alphaproteobacteria bacterium]|nr:hypothetical protein [Alphaproteobacteria bacterium]
MTYREEAPAANEGQSKESLLGAASNLALNADPEKVRDFFTLFGGPFHLSRAGDWRTCTFADIDLAVERACANNNAGRCIYYMGNQPRSPLRKRACENDIKVCVGAWLDIDDPDSDIFEELTNRLDWAPFYVAFTGGGWQAHWRFDNPTSDTEDARAIGSWLRSEFADLSPDSTHSVEHLFRLPGTRNRKAERDDRMCEVLFADAGARLPLAEAGRIKPTPSVVAAPVDFDDEFEFSLHALWEVLPPWALRLLNSCVRDIETGEAYPSRSEHEWAFIGACVRDGIAPLSVVRNCLLLPAGQQEIDKVSHRAHWAKIRGRYVPRRNPTLHVERQIASFLAKESIDG